MRKFLCSLAAATMLFCCIRPLSQAALAPKRTPEARKVARVSFMMRKVSSV